MKTDARQRELLTAEQAADNLQINRETVYRYIREGKLVASRLGRTYRIPRANIEMFLWAARTRDVPLREYSQRDIEEFLKRDEPDAAARSVMREFQSAGDSQPIDRSKKAAHPRTA